MAKVSRQRRRGTLKHDRGFWVLGAVLVFIFLLGGASRSDVLSLPFLRASSAGMLAWLIARHGRVGLNDARIHVQAIGVIALFLLVQVIPLPPSIWQLLPGREIMVDIAKTAGLEGSWRPFAMVPHAAWNALFSLFIPAVAVAAAGFAGQRNDRNLVGLIIAIATFAAMLGIVQLGVGRVLPVYLYSVTNDDSAVGLMANRNHHALFLSAVIPLIAVWLSTIKAEAKKLQAVTYTGLAGVAVLIPLIIAVGSRAGLVLGTVGLASAAIIYRRPPPLARRRAKIEKAIDERLVIAAAIFALIIFSLLSARYTAFDRMADDSLRSSDRVELIPVLFQMIKTHFPFGSGAGSFVTVFEIFEPDTMVFEKYYNHAHNDFLELVAEHGVAGLALIVGAVTGWLYAARWILFGCDPENRREQVVLLGVAGLAILMLCAIGSAVDYPVRVPSISALVAISTLWVTRALTAVRDNSYS